MRVPTSATRVAGVIGDPVRHSLSPVLHNAAFAELGLDWVYVAFPVTAGQGASAVEAVRTLDLAGLSVTMPHKADAAGAVDRLGPVAARLGVINTVSWSRNTVEAELVGDSTDGDGFLDALAKDEGFDPTGRWCTVLGTGGAARAVTMALGTAGAASVAVVGRRADATADCAALAGAVGRPVVATSADAVRETLAASHLVVNATPQGMHAHDPAPFGVEAKWIRPDMFVADLIYTPAATPLLAEARAAGASVCNGIGMLIHQAGRQVELWTGRPAPLDAMSAAAVAALTQRR